MTQEVRGKAAAKAHAKAHTVWETVIQQSSKLILVEDPLVFEFLAVHAIAYVSIGVKRISKSLLLGVLKPLIPANIFESGQYHQFDGVKHPQPRP